MVANLYWHRPETNPKANETSGALNFGIGFLNSIPVQWVVLGVVMLLGLAYYGRVTATCRRRCSRPGATT